MKRLKWKQDNEFCWSLYDTDTFVGMVSLNAEGAEYAGLWGGMFHTSDDGLVSVNPIGSAILQAKERIQDNYLLDRPYEWWMR